MKTWLTRTFMAALLLGLGYGTATAVQAYRTELAYAQQQKHLRDCCGSAIETETVFAVLVGLGDGMAKDAVAKLEWEEKTALVRSWQAMAALHSVKYLPPKFNDVFQAAGRKAFILLASAGLAESDLEDLLEAISVQRDIAGGRLTGAQEQQLQGLFAYRNNLASTALETLSEVNKLYYEASMKTTQVLGQYRHPPRGIEAGAEYAVKALHPELFHPALAR
jgi:hypothetical protein